MPTRSEKPFPKRFARWGWPLLPALAALAVYANAVPNGFLHDDVDLVAQNSQILSLTGLQGPVTVASFALNRALTGSGPVGFHAVNVLLHALVCWLVWFAGRRVGLHYGTALATAFLFAVHPLHTEAVAGIFGRGELLAAAGVLAAWLCHRRAWDGSPKRGLWVAGAAAFYAFAVLSQWHTILAPVLFMIDDRLRSRESDLPRQSVWLPYAAYSATLALAGTVRLVTLDGVRGAGTAVFLDNPAAFAGLPARIGTALWVQVKYAGLFVWPSRLSSDYSYNAVPVVSSWSDPRLWAGIGFVLALLAAFAWCWKRSRPLTIGIATWVLFFLPSSNLLFVADTVMDERLAYLPLLGGCLIVGHFLAWLASASSPLPDRGRLRAALPILIALSLTLVLGARAASRNPDWRDNSTLALRDAKTMPNSARLQAGAGIAHAAGGDTAAAERSFRRALEIYPGYARVRFNLGELLMHRGDSVEAQQMLKALADEAPGSVTGILARALSHEARDEFDRADELYREVLKRDDLPAGVRASVNRRLSARPGPQ